MVCVRTVPLLIGRRKPLALQAVMGAVGRSNA
jgi:hypothetical protein